MNITNMTFKEKCDKVIAALEIAKATLIEYGDWWPVGEPIAIVDCAEALSIMRGLAEDAEPAGWKLVPIDSTHEMVAAYLKANTDYWERTDALPNHPSKWRNGTPQEATAVGYHAMLAAAPPAPNDATSPQAQTEAAGPIELKCKDVIDYPPQAAQTALKSESLAQAAQALARLPSEGKPIEALAPTEAALSEVVRLSEDMGLYGADFQTEAQEREAFEAFMLTKYPTHVCNWVNGMHGVEDRYGDMFTRLHFVGWLGRAGSKP